MSRKLVAPAVCTFACEIGIQIFRLRPPKEVSFSRGPTRSEKTTCDGRRSFKAEDLKPIVAVIGGIFPPNFQPW
jgi:hypothetical protein